MNTFVMDAATITTTATTTSERLAAEEDSKTGAATVEAEQIEGIRLQCSKCNKKAMKDAKGLCWEHGERKRCEHPDCIKLARKEWIL